MTVQIEREFLHGRPAEAVRLLGEAGAPTPAERWLLGAALGALGRYGEAKTLLTDVIDAAPPPPHRSLAASTLASHYRQLGRHAEARGWDEEAAAWAGGDPEARFDAALGLAADAVGAGDLAAARTRCGEIAEPASRISPQHWRRRVRYGWVLTEVALLAGDPSAAVEAARSGLAVAEEAAAPRHVAKCLLFLGAFQHVDAGQRSSEPDLAVRATATLRKAASAARSVSAAPLCWVAEALLAEAAARRGDDDQARCHRNAAKAAILQIAGWLSEEDRRLWLGRPDIAAIAGISE